MPSLLSISFVFKKPVLATLVQDFYNHFLDESISFSQVHAWGCEADMPLDEIIIWNQCQIDQNFIPDGNTKISQYPRQLSFSIADFSTARLIMSNSDSYVEFTCIIPETEVKRSNIYDIEKASLNVWNKLPVNLIDTFGELDDPVGVRKVQSGQLPLSRVFAMINCEFNQEKLNSIVHIAKLDRGYLLKPKNQNF